MMLYNTNMQKCSLYENNSLYGTYCIIRNFIVSTITLAHAQTVHVSITYTHMNLDTCRLSERSEL